MRYAAKDLLKELSGEANGDGCNSWEGAEKLRPEHI